MVFNVNPFTWRPSMLVLPRRFYSRYLVYVGAFFVSLWTLHYFVRLQDRTAVEQPWTVPSVWSDRALQVRDSFLHAYHGYELHAAPLDELKPLSNASTNTYDSVFSLLLYGLLTILPRLKVQWVGVDSCRLSGHHASYGIGSRVPKGRRHRRKCKFHPSHRKIVCFV